MHNISHLYRHRTGNNNKPRKMGQRRRRLIRWGCSGALLLQQWLMWRLSSGMGVLNIHNNNNNIILQNNMDAPLSFMTTSSSHKSSASSASSSSASSLLFSWNDLDYTIPPDCGTFKCFYRSKSQPNQTGYLIAPGIQKEDQQRAWHISQSIDSILSDNNKDNDNGGGSGSGSGSHEQQQQQQQPQARHHFYSPVPPWKVRVNDTILSLLQQLGRKNNNKTNVNHNLFVLDDGSSRSSSSSSLSSFLIVQQVDVAPRTELKVLGCSAGRMRNSCNLVTHKIVMENLPPKHGEKKKNNNNNNINSSSSSSSTINNDIDIETAKRTFHRSIENTLKVLQVHPNLVHDFQVFLNSRGEIYHFDLDRGQKTPSSADIQTCITNLQLYARLV